MKYTPTGETNLKDTLNILAINVKSLRKMRKLSTEKFAEFCDISRSAVIEIEKASGNPTIQTLKNISEACSTPISSLFCHDMIIEKSSSILPEIAQWIIKINSLNSPLQHEVVSHINNLLNLLDYLEAE